MYALWVIKAKKEISPWEIGNGVESCRERRTVYIKALLSERLYCCTLYLLSKEHRLKHLKEEQAKPKRLRILMEE